LIFAFALLLAGPTYADNAWKLEDVKGGQDHPLIKRFAGSWLVGYQSLSYDRTTFPSKLGLVGMNELDTPLQAEGKITRLMYIAPYGKGPFEVHKNYQDALKAAGFQTTLDCVGKACDGTPYGYIDRLGEMSLIDISKVVRQNPTLKDKLDDVDSGQNLWGSHDKDMFMTLDTITVKDKPVYVLINTDKHFSADIAITYIEIVEPKDMDHGQVSVDTTALQTSDAMASSMDKDGKIAIYGIYFDTGNAAIKPESKPQLDEMAKYLTTHPDQNVFIVGHTDNQGNFASNLKLSMARAKAVTTALTTQYKIPTTRMTAQGVANLSPLAPNSDDAGRAKNRRVELVAQ
jgi:OOP family OmpA-OmpF porin